MTNDTWLGLSNPFLTPAGSEHQMHRDALPAFTAMQEAAREDGVDCQLVSSFRNFDRQAAIWNRKWRGELPLYNEQGELLTHSQLSDDEKLIAILTWSAMPGASRHHWGTDIDVYDKQSVDEAGGQFDLIDSEYCEGGPCYALSGWLDQHAEAFGFYRPFAAYCGGVATEKWHLSYRPVAEKFEALRNPQALFDALSQADIEGKSVVLAQFDQLYPRYVLNQGTPR